MIPITKPSLGEKEAASVKDVIFSGWVTQGPKTTEFEERFASYVGASHGCAVSSCTTALHLALRAVGVGPGDVVITVSHTFIATANAVRHCGAEPVFVDIDPYTYNLSPTALERCLHEDFEETANGLYYRDVNRLVSEKPFFQSRSGIFGKQPRRIGRAAAILPVHQMGIPCEIQRIVEISKRFGLPVVEDAACAIGSEVSGDGGKTWDKIGKPHGDIACFSFHPRKVITTGDGGMITTDNSEYDESFRLLRQHGMSISDTVRNSSSSVIFEEYIVTGYNYRLTDIQAAIGIEQLKKLDVIVGERRRLAKRYDELLKDNPIVMTTEVSDAISPNWQSYPVRLANDIMRSQKDIMQALLDKGIATRRGIMNIHQEPAYKNGHWFLPHSESSRDRVILVPLYPGMRMKTVDYIAETLIMETGRNE